VLFFHCFHLDLFTVKSIYAASLLTLFGFLVYELFVALTFADLYRHMQRFLHEYNTSTSNTPSISIPYFVHEQLIADLFNLFFYQAASRCTGNEVLYYYYYCHYYYFLIFNNIFISSAGICFCFLFSF
jgi:hypothetical protein